MPDIAHVETDKMLEKMEKRIKSIYRQAEKELREKWDEFAQDVGLKTMEMYGKLQRGEITQAEYYEFVNGMAKGDEHWQNMVENASAEYTHANEIALAYINGRMPDVYSLNYNFVETGVENAVKGFSYEMVDASTVAFLVQNNQLLLPKKSVDVPKDLRWNKKQINAQLIQSILQGESNDKLAKRLRNITDMTASASIRNARTMTTSCENKGRQDSMERAESMGINLVKQWLCTYDQRTRESHLLAGGQTVGIHEKFKVGDSELEYPADPKGSPHEVYNCRCTMIQFVKGFGSVTATSNPTPRTAMQTVTTSDEKLKSILSKA